MQWWWSWIGRGLTSGESSLGPLFIYMRHWLQYMPDALNINPQWEWLILLGPGITHPMTFYLVCGNRKFKRELIYIHCLKVNEYFSFHCLKVNDILVFIVWRLRIFVTTLMPWCEGEIGVLILFGNLSISWASMYLESI